LAFRDATFFFAMANEGGQPYIIWFSDPESADVAKVGGKNASLGAR
jgi:hypothetical protein